MLDPLPFAEQPRAHDRLDIGADAAFQAISAIELVAQLRQSFECLGFQATIGQFLNAISQPAFQVTPVEGRWHGAEQLAPLFTQVRRWRGFQRGEANPVCAALPPICEKLLAHAVVDGPATTEQDAIDWRETISSFRLIPVDPAVKVYAEGVSVVQPASPAIIGIGVRRDHEKQGRPFHSWANQPVQGIVGPSRPINFSLTDGATEGQRLLSANIGVILRGEMGVESAIGQGGFIFVGTDNAGEDDLWRFYNVTRGRDFIHLMLLRTLRFYLGRFNVTGQTIQAILNTMETGLRNLKADGDILGFELKFTRDQNTPEELRQGRFTVSFAAEEAPVLRYLGIQSARYRPALDALLDDLLAQVGTITG